MTRTRSASVQRSLTDLDQVSRLAAQVDRHDLAQRLQQARTRLVGEDVPVAVVGEFKQGKSTLINALLRTEICPVDADLGTAVPMIVRYGVPPSVTAHLISTDGLPSSVSVPFERLGEHVTESAGDSMQARTVEVRLDRRLLRSGLSLVDTPGVGGLDSVQGNVTLGALPMARAVLFVTDSAQEFTAPELEFLVRTIERCRTVLCVVTKIDLYAQWRRIVDLNRGHLSRAGLAVPMVAVSSFLRLRAAAVDDATLNAESGFPRLLDFLRRQVLAGSDTAAVNAAAREIVFVLAQVREQVGAQRLAARRPEVGEALIGTLTEKARRHQQFAAGAATWQVVLGDGMVDLGNQVRDDLDARLAAMVRRGEALIDEGDPGDSVPELEAWITREAVAAAVDNLFVVVSRSEQLARVVAERFDLEYDGLDLDLPAPTTLLGEVAQLDVRLERSSMRQLLAGATAARVIFSGVLLVGAFANPLTIAPIGAVLGLTIGRKLLRDERDRQLEHRRQQAKQALRRYVSDVGLAIGRNSRDGVTQVRRFFRDEFATRGALAERSSELAVAAVRQAATAPEPERAQRAQRLDAQWRDLEVAAERAHAGVPAVVVSP